MNSPLTYIDLSGLSQCNPAQQSWCNGVGVPGSGWLGGGGRSGYGTRTVNGWGTYVTFGIYHQIVRIWRSSSSFSSWGAGGNDGGWSDDIFWEDVQHTVVYPIVSWFRWALQVVEQSVAAEPASSHSPDSGGSIAEQRPSRSSSDDYEPGLDEGWEGILTDPLNWFGGGLGKAGVRGAWNWFRGLLFPRGVVRGYPHTVDDLLRNATTPGSSGVSPIARAIDKHAAQPGSAYPPAVGNQSAKNEAAAELARSILTNPQSTFVKGTTGRFGEVVDVIAPDGRGLRFGEGGRFIHLLEPPR